MVKLFFRVKWFNFCEQLYVIRNFYRQPRFALTDLLLGIVSLVLNPYRICKSTYGETPLRSLQKIAKASSLSSTDHYLELGSGRGKGCFWVSCFIGCKVTGVEEIPLFVRLSKMLCIHVIQESMFVTDLSKATVVYFYHLASSRPQFETMQPGARLITISEPIQSDVFTLVQVLDIEFPWGTTQAYVQRRI